MNKISSYEKNGLCSNSPNKMILSSENKHFYFTENSQQTMKPNTGQGDQGTTRTLTKKRIRKDSQEIEAIGTIDEVISYLSIVEIDTKEKKLIEEIQKKLYLINAEIASLGKRQEITKEDVKGIEENINEQEKNLPKQTSFITTFNNKTAAQHNYARTIIRKAERRIHALKQTNSHSKAYLNRLSDLFFIMARRYEEE